MLVILFGELLLSLVLTLVGKLLKNNDVKRVGLLLLKQGFVTVVMFNIFNVAFSAGVHWKYAKPTDENYVVSSLILFGTLGSMLISVFAMELLSE